MRVRAGFLFLMIAMVRGGMLHGQTAAELDSLLASPAVTVAQASRFVLALADGAEEAPARAYALALESGWLPKKASADSPIKLGELCFLIMNAFNMKGSFLYALFPGPHYAFRELDYLRLIPGRRDPSLKVSGEWFLQILGMVSDYRGVPLGAEGPAPVPAVEAAVNTAAEREQIAEDIRTELEQQEVRDTSVRVAEEGVVISLDNIRFMPDSVELLEEEKVKLWKISLILVQYPARKILVGGHTAMAGDEAGRLRISVERARQVADFLISLGVRQAEDITVWGYGAERPLGNNATEEGQAINRRVEIILLDEGQ